MAFPTAPTLGDTHAEDDFNYVATDDGNGALFWKRVSGTANATAITNAQLDHAAQGVLIAQNTTAITDITPIDDDTLAAESDTAPATQGSTKAYVDAQIEIVTVTSGVDTLTGRRLAGSTIIEATAPIHAEGDFSINQPDPADFPLWWVQPVTNDRFTETSVWKVAIGALGDNIWKRIDGGSNDGVFAVSEHYRFGQGNDAALMQDALLKFTGSAANDGAVNLGIAGGTVSLPRFLELEDTVELDQAHVTFIGTGAHTSARPYVAASTNPAWVNWDRNNGTVIKWEGPTGGTMFQYSDYREITWSGVRFEGNDDNPPAIMHRFQRTTGSSIGGSIGKNFEHCVLGKWQNSASPGSSDLGAFDTAIVCDGVNGNNDRLRLDKVRIQGPTIAGINLAQSQSVWNDFENVWIGEGEPGATAIITAASIDGGILQLQRMDRGIDGPEFVRINFQVINAENTRELARLRNGATLTVRGGIAQVGHRDPNYNGGGVQGDFASLNGMFIDARDAALSTRIKFENFNFANQASLSPMATFGITGLDGNDAPPVLELDGCRMALPGGIVPQQAMLEEMLETGVASALDQRLVQIDPMPNGRIVRHHINPGKNDAAATLDLGRYDLPASVYAEDVTGQPQDVTDNSGVTSTVVGKVAANALLRPGSVNIDTVTVANTNEYTITLTNPVNSVNSPLLLTAESSASRIITGNFVDDSTIVAKTYTAAGAPTAATFSVMIP